MVPYDPPDRASPSDITRSSDALGAPCPARLAGFLLSNDASELGARVDCQLGVDVPQVAVHRVWREEEPVRDLTVRAAVGDEPRDVCFRAAQGRQDVAVAMAAGRDDPPVDTEVAKAAADATSVPLGTEGEVQLESSPQDRDTRGAIDRHQAPTVVLERGSKREAARALLEERDRPFEILEPLLDQAADLRLDRRDRLDPWVELHSPSNRGERLRGQTGVADRQRDPSQVNLVGDVDREARKQRVSILLARRHQPAVRRGRVT